MKRRGCRGRERKESEWKGKERISLQVVVFVKGKETEKGRRKGPEKEAGKG